MFSFITKPWPTNAYGLLNEEELRRLDMERRRDVDVDSALQTVDALWACGQSRWNEDDVPLFVNMIGREVHLSYRLAPGFIITEIRDLQKSHGPFVQAARKRDEQSVPE